MKNLLTRLKKKKENEIPLLTVTDAAREKVKSIIENEEGDVQGLRVSIQGRTASEFQYGLGLEVEAAPDDVIVDCGDIQILIDPESAKSLKGVTIDYVEDLNSSGFKIDNPNTPTWDNPIKFTQFGNASWRFHIVLIYP